MCRTDGNLAIYPDGKKAKTWMTLVHPIIVSFTNLIHVPCLNPVLCSCVSNVMTLELLTDS